MNFKVRAARKEDCKDVSRMLMEFAVFANMMDQMTISHEDLERDGFCQNPFFECLIAEVPEEHKSKDGFSVVGYALYFYSYTTWNGRSVYLEDLYVMQEFRGNGIEKSLLGKVAEIGKEKNCVMFQLSVWKWNSPADEIYAAGEALDPAESHGRKMIGFDKLNMEKLAMEAPKD